MKKLLAILSAVSLTTVASTSVISCNWINAGGGIGGNGGEPLKPTIRIVTSITKFENMKIKPIKSELEYYQEAYKNAVELNQKGLDQMLENKPSEDDIGFNLWKNFYIMTDMMKSWYDSIYSYFLYLDKFEYELNIKNQEDLKLITDKKILLQLSKIINKLATTNDKTIKSVCIVINELPSPSKNDISEYNNVRRSVEEFYSIPVTEYKNIIDQLVKN